jgi:hypothetical protein
MSIAIVQTLAASETSNSTSLQSSAFGSSPTTGNTIAVAVTGVNNTSTTTLSLTDTEGNSYVCALCNGYSNGATDVISNPASNNISSGTSFASLWYAENITGGSSFKITATWGASGASSAIDISAAEISGLGSSVTTDVTQAGNGASSDPATGSFSTSNANDVILLAMTGITSSLSGATITLPSGFTVIGQGVPGGMGKHCISFCYQIVSSTQSGIDPAFTTTNITVCTAIAVAFEGASSAPSAPTGLTITNDATNPTTVLDLSWNSVSGATSYNVLQASTLAGTFSQVASGISGTSTTITGLTAGTEYAFEVEAVNGSGTSSPSSALAWATAPGAPTLGSATVTATTITIPVTAPSVGATIAIAQYPYRYESPVGAGNWTGGDALGTATSVQLTGLSPNAQYGVEVAANIGSNNDDWGIGPGGAIYITGAYSSELTAETGGGPLDPASGVCGGCAAASGLVAPAVRTIQTAVMRAATW